MRQVSSISVATLTAVVAIWLTLAAGGAGLTDAFAGQLSGINAPTDIKANSAGPSKPAFETLRGASTGGIYVLGHGSVIPGTESVTVGGSRKLRGTDYSIDYAGGTIVFTESVRSGYAVTVSYRYAAGAETGARAIVGLPGLQLASTPNLNLNFSYSYRLANQNGGQSLSGITTYGINATNKLGLGSSLSSMFYVSNPQKSAALIDHLAPTAQRASNEKPQSGQLIVENGDFGIGGLKLKLGYQSVGQNFSGFESLQQSNTAPAELIGTLAKEKGLRRLNMQADLGLGLGSSVTAEFGRLSDKKGDISTQALGYTSNNLKLKMTSSDIGAGFARFADIKEADRDVMAKEKGLRRFGFQADANLGNGMAFNASTNEIRDKSGDIQNRTLGLASNRMKVNYSTSEVGTGFTRAKDLREANREQLGKEVGIKRTSLALELAPRGAAKDTLWNRFNMGSISDARGSMSSHGFALAAGKLGMSYSNRSVDRGFTRLGSLTKDDLTQIALEVRQQFDPTATAAQVTDADRQQAAALAGIERTNWRADLAGKSNKTDLQILSIADGTGSADRRGLNLAGKNYSLTFGQQSISDSFSRLGQLAAVEKAQFGNERGMSRTSFAGTMKGKTAGYSANFARVTDTLGADFVKQSFGFTGQKVTLSANFQNVGTGFTRGADLADANRAEIAKLKGISQSNIAAALKMKTGDLAMGLTRFADDNSAGIARQSLGFAGKKLSLKANFLDVDPNFARIADLALPDAEKNDLTQEKGFSRKDVAANLILSPRMNLESYFYNSDNATANISRAQQRNRLSYATKTGARLSLFRDDYTTAAPNAKDSGYVHQLMTFDHKLSLLGGLSLNSYQDVNRKLTADGGDVTTTITQTHLESDKAKRAWGIVDGKTIDYGDGRFENTQSVNFQTRPTKKLSLTGALTNIDRGNQGSEETRAHTAQWALTPKMNFTSDVIDKTGVKTGTTAKRIYGLSGTLADKFSLLRNVKLAANRSSEDKDGGLFRNSKAVNLESDVPALGILRAMKVSYSRAVDNSATQLLRDAQALKIDASLPRLAMFTNAKVAFTRSTQSGVGIPLTPEQKAELEKKKEKPVEAPAEANAVRFESNLLNGSFAAEYSDTLPQTGASSTARGFSFTSDREQKKKLHLDVAYKTSICGVAAPVVARTHNLNYKLNQNTSLIYTLFSARQVAQGKTDPTDGSALKVVTALGSMGLTANFENAWDSVKHSGKRGCALGLSGKLASGALVELGYAIDDVLATATSTGSRTYRIKFDQQIDSDHLLTFTGEMKALDNTAPGVQNDLVARLDLRIALG